MAARRGGLSPRNSGGRFRYRLRGTYSAYDLTLSLGIEGKRMLWKVLGTLASSDGRLVGFDFAGLERRAESQRRRLEPFRLELAAVALAH